MVKSGLQKLQYKVAFAIGYRLQFFNARQIGDLAKSQHTLNLIAEHEKITRELKLSIKSDYIKHRDKVLAVRLQLKEGSLMIGTKKPVS